MCGGKANPLLIRVMGMEHCEGGCVDVWVCTWRKSRSSARYCGAHETLWVSGCVGKMDLLLISVAVEQWVCVCG